MLMNIFCFCILVNIYLSSEALGRKCLFALRRTFRVESHLHPGLASFTQSVGCGARQTWRQKVVVLRELHRAIIYTTEIDKRAGDKKSREDAAHAGASLTVCQVTVNTV